MHAAVLAPQHVDFIDFDPSDLSNIPQYDAASTLLLFPSEEASSIADIDFSSVSKVVAVDSTWFALSLSFCQHEMMLTLVCCF